MVKAVIHKLPKDDWKLKSVTVSQDSVGNYFASVLFEYEQEDFHEKQVLKRMKQNQATILNK